MVPDMKNTHPTARSQRAFVGAPEAFDRALELHRPEALATLRARAGLTHDALCTWLGCHRTTLARLAPTPARAPHRLLAVLSGALPWAAWSCWHVSALDGALVDGETGARFTPAQARQVGVAWASAREARRMLRVHGLDAAAEALERESGRPAR